MPTQIPDSLLAASAAHSRRAAQDKGNSQTADVNKQRSDYYMSRASASKRGDNPDNVIAPFAIAQDLILNEKKNQPIYEKEKEEQEEQLKKEREEEDKRNEQIRQEWEEKKLDPEIQRQSSNISLKDAPSHFDTEYASIPRAGWDVDNIGVSLIDMANSTDSENANSINDIYESIYANEDTENEGNPDYQALRADSGNFIHELNKNSVDDGTPTYEARTSDTMTGSQYRKYVEETGTGLDPDFIDDNRAYSKMEEARLHGFVPYIPDNRTFDKMKDQAGYKSASNMFNELANARTSIFDYTVDYNGEKYSGRELDEKLPAYLQAQQRNVKNNNAEQQIFATQEEAGEGALPVKISSRTYFINGQPYTVKSLADFEEYETPSEVILNFPDTGEKIVIPNAEGRISGNFVNNYEYVNSPEEADAWISNSGTEDLELSDGRKLSYLDAVAIVNGAGEKDYGPMNLGKPASVMNEEGDILGNILPYTADLILGSAPLFNPYTAVLQGVANAGSAASGLDARSLRPTLAHENTTDDQYISGIVGNLIMPFTERLAGNVGGKALFGSNGILGGITKKLTGKFGEQAWAPASRVAEDIVGEGLEEIFPGQPVEDLIANGGANLFANQVLDESGKPVYDSTGHEVRDANTPFWDRIQNYAQDMGENFAGGAWLSTLLGLPHARSVIRQTKGIRDYNKEAKEAGLPIIRPPKNRRNEDLWEGLDDDLRAWYDEEESDAY